MVAGVLCVVFVDVLVFYFVISWYWVSTKVSQDSGSDEYQWSTTASVGHLAAGCLSRVSLLGAYWFFSSLSSGSSSFSHCASHPARST